VEDIEVYVRKKCPAAFKNIIKADSGKSGFITNDRAAYENHYNKIRYDNDDDRQTALLIEDDDEEGTTVLTRYEEEEDEENTTLLCEPEVRYPVLEREKTNDRIEIRQNTFSIGKDAGNDFVISDNKAVSRRHALIERQSDDYYIVDKGSTNHTYLNGEMLEQDRKYVLSGDDRIRVADEELLFYFE
jgi:hypothetical protein